MIKNVMNRERYTIEDDIYIYIYIYMKAGLDNDKGLDIRKDNHNYKDV